MDYKQLIIDALDIMRKREVAEKQTFKARAYSKVITQLKAHSQPIRSIEDAEGISGVGKEIHKKMIEVIETGTLRAVQEIRQKYNFDALDTFQAIYGVGPAKATDLVNAGYTSIAELRAEVATNSKLLNDKQKIGLKYYEDLIERIPREEMLDHKYIIEKYAPKEFNYEIVGSFRRNAESSGDIDVLIRIPDNITPAQSDKLFKAFIVKMQKDKYIKEVLALGDKKCMAISALPNGKARRLDLLMTPSSEYAYAILYFTGSDKFNVAFRQHALDKGYTLNEHTLTPIRQDIPTPPYMGTEEDIFRFLGIKYVEPGNRIDGSSISMTRKRPAIASNSISE
jgi:DNA polymerase beta